MFPDLYTVSQLSENTGQVTVIIILLTSLVFLTFIILRLGWFDEPVSSVSSHLPMTSVEKVHNPFVLSITNIKEATIEDGTTVSITSHVPCYIRIYWGMLITDIYPLIHQLWNVYQQSLQDDNFKDFALYSEEIIEVEPITNKCFDLRPPSTELSEDLGKPPRDRYPLVIVLCDLRVIDEHFKESWTNQVISSISMFHVKDVICPGDTQVIAQYVRTPYGKPCNLQQLYVTENIPEGSTSPDQADTIYCGESQVDVRSQCVVCLNKTVSRAFLPCRHACVCDICYSRLTHCPMCRTLISRSFHIEESS